MLLTPPANTYEIFLCHGVAPAAIWQRESRTDVSPGLLHWMLLTCARSLLKSFPSDWSRNLSSQTKRTYDFAAEKVTLPLRKCDGPAAIPPKVTQQILSSFLWAILARKLFPPSPPLLLLYFLGTVSDLFPNDSFLSVGMTDIQIRANEFLFSTLLQSQQRSYVYDKSRKAVGQFAWNDNAVFHSPFLQKQNCWHFAKHHMTLQ